MVGIVQPGDESKPEGGNKDTDRECGADPQEPLPEVRSVPLCDALPAIG